MVQQMMKLRMIETQVRLMMLILIPNVLRGVENVDLSTTIFGKKLELPFYLAPTALQRLFHYDGERAVGKAAQKFNTMFWSFSSCNCKC